MVDRSVVRMNISVPSKLKARMDKAKTSVNWSSIASRAFEDELHRISKSQEEVKMTDVVNRLRQSKHIREAGLDKNYREGFALGQDWASNRAELIELENFEDCNRFHPLVDEDEGGGGSGHYLWETIVPTDECTREEFEMRLVGGDKAKLDRLGNARYWKGFVEGVLTIWVEVKDKI